MAPSSAQKRIIQSISSNCLSVRLRLLNRMVGAIYDEALRPHGVKASQMNILVAIAAFQQVTSQQLCGLLQMDTSTLSRALARMKKKQWVRLEPSGEGKILKIEVTEEGYQKIEQVYPAWKRAQARATENLGEAASRMLIASGNEHLLGAVSS